MAVFRMNRSHAKSGEMGVRMVAWASHIHGGKCLSASHCFIE